MIDRVIEHIDETLIHKQYILQSARILSRYLIENGNMDIALELVKRCSAHDDSKFSPDEIYAFIKLSNKESLKNAKAALDEATKEALKMHWENNSHHPEHFADYSMMTDLDLMEMACDCNARSMQYGTDLLNFIEIRQEERFHFPIEMYNKFKEYCNILVYYSKDYEDTPKMLIKKKDE